MSKLIKLTCQQIIDFNSECRFEKSIFTASYREFVSRFVAYNNEGKWQTFNEVKDKNGKALVLHSRLNSAVAKILDSLDNQIPCLQDTLGNNISFDRAELQLIDSSIEDEKLHSVKILYTTEVLVLHQVIGEYLLLSKNKISRNAAELTQTFMIKSKQGLSISAYCEREQQCVTEQTLGLARNTHLFSEIGMI